MGALKPSPPTPVDVVSAQEVNGLISETERQLAALEAERAEAETAAAWAERRARAEPLDPELHQWAAEQLNRFLDQLRTEHEAEMRVLLSTAEARARQCVAHARSEADFIISYARAITETRRADASEQSASTAASVFHSGPTPEARPPVTAAATEPIPLAPSLLDAADDPPPVAPTGPVQVLTPPVGPTPHPVAAPAPAPSEVPDRRPPQPDPSTAAVAAAPAVHPTAEPAPAGDAPVPAPPRFDADDAPPTARDGAAAPAAVASDPSVHPPDTAPSASPPGPSDAAPPPPTGDGPGRPGPGGPEEQGFWPQEPESKFRRFTRRIHGLAILQVLAVLVILVVVLLRIG
jgi:hypothetical protein